uniref:GED domain-containing protein n=1 Tax=Kalanchoe fedtschenkoi TaxID=63787 RepID=A0A7N0UQF5_KALFE
MWFTAVNSQSTRFLVPFSHLLIFKNLRLAFNRENLFEEILQEPEEIAKRRKETWETLRALQLAMRTLDELPLDGENGNGGHLGGDTTGLPKIHGLPSSSFYSSSSGSHDSYSASPKPSRSRKSSHSGELQSPFHPNADSNGNGRIPASVQYPAVYI